MTWVEGIDAAWSRPSADELTAAGKAFIVGYVSHDPAKNLTAADCLAYLDAGIAVGLVWELTANRALTGKQGGLSDGKEARAQATALGFPADRPIFTAVDFDASTRQLTGAVHDYLAAFAKAVGGKDFAGVYGGRATVTYALDEGLVRWGWQTYAWSAGMWDTRAQVRQYRNGYQLAGHDTDLDRATDLSPFWTRENIDMAITDADAQKIASALLSTKLGKGDTTVGMALQTEIANAVAAEVATQLAALPAAIISQLPQVGGVTSSGDFEVTGTVHVDAAPAKP